MNIVIPVLLTCFAGCLYGLANRYATDAGSVADWIGAISTLGALIYLGIERYKSDKKAKREQASHISAWFTDSPQTDLGDICISNKSNEPVFEVIISVVTIQGAGVSDAKGIGDYEFRSYIGVLPPGDFLNTIRFGGNGMMMRFALEIAFTDCSGNHFVRKGNGQLSQIKESASKYYNITLPIGWA